MSRLLISAAAAASVVLLLVRRSPSSIQTVNRLFTERFDQLFIRHCPTVPLPYLRALTKHESDFNPLDAEGPAHGLLQVVEVVREGYNRRFGTTFTRAQLLDPSINVQIACELIARIARVLPANHPQAIPAPSWTDPRFVGLVTFAWNAGFSEASGMGFVLGIMERRGIKPQDIHIDSVLLAAREIPDPQARFLKLSIRAEFSKRVVRDYFAQISQV